MKTKVLSILAVLMCSVTLIYAKDPQSTLQQAISKEIQLPSSTYYNQSEEAVFIEFAITDDGKIEIIKTSLVGELQSYVYEKVSAMKVETTPDMIGKTYMMRFDFNQM